MVLLQQAASDGAGEASRPGPVERGRAHVRHHPPARRAQGTGDPRSDRGKCHRLRPISARAARPCFDLLRHQAARAVAEPRSRLHRSEEHTSELQSLMRSSYAVFCLKTKKTTTNK